MEAMTVTQAAKYLQKSPRTLTDWRVQRRGPAYIKISGREVRYLKADIDAWINSRPRIDPQNAK